nr:hypothetical protein [Nonomuraea basaltis]
MDATLIFRYFGSKKRLFDEATADIPIDLLDGPQEELVARMLGSVVFHDWRWPRPSPPAWRRTSRAWPRLCSAAR